MPRFAANLTMLFTTGEIDLRFLLRPLDRIGHRGFVGCEYRPLARTEGGLAWMEEYA